MPKTTGILTEARYARLVKDVRALIAEGRGRAAQAANQELVATYWKVGERITKEGLTENAGYGEAVLEDLSEELDIDVDTLERCIRFFKTYKSAPRGGNLMWTHYKALLPLQDEKQRKWYETLVTEKKMTGEQLRTAIRERRFDTQKTKGKNAGVQNIEPLRRPATPTYLYKAAVKRVIDGDTLLLVFDLGFLTFREQRIRLALIDTPAMDEPGGREAYRYVRDQLAKVEFVMVKTNKIDIYGRYVGHVFYSLSEKGKDEVFLKGNYLNQELVARGLASIF